ncbi:phospholipase D family protein [Methylocystis sp. MJC1]|uniref:phospholipase D family protein n=1 Tax=Methylocystis sp. MJC1 TaxID=2654282 RepID=UPI0013EBF2B5|nr:phospholipase D family protein [Methylocystis sp. MJC1]KAF2991124.1 hypothetical protein MJC1_01857 [Methylocystis sp. MJC1]MBU6525953.1 phospholipase D family protein [Methylocystis sp. MJC1]UZX12420.1 phospholipase D family protein [Methylocystis sp. MJC1]
MAKFLTGSDLSSKILDLLSFEHVQCAVAFWGDGAAKILKESSPKHWKTARIICDLSMGGTYPPELEKLGAPGNEKLRYLNGLHAKVYISDGGAVIASANMSSNGIGFAERGQAGLIEAGTFHAREEPAWDEITSWFNRAFADAKLIDKDALGLAWRRWSPPKGAGKTKCIARTDSLLDMVRVNPELFEDIGFVFVRYLSDKVEIERARRSLGKVHPAKRKEINEWPSSNIFAGWSESEIRRWPSTFFEFWMPGEKLSIMAREVAYFNHDDGAVFAKSAWQAVKARLDGALPTRNAIAKADGKIAKIIIERSDEGQLFQSPDELWKVLVKLQADKG